VTSALRYLFVVLGAVCSILLFLLASASDNSGFFDRYFSWLLGLNAAVAVSLLLLVGVSLFRLYARYKSGKFGAKLMTRLVLLFASVGVLPEPAPKPQVQASIQRAPSSIAAMLLATARERLL